MYPEKVKNFSLVKPGLVEKVPSVVSSTVTTVKRPFASLYGNPVGTTISTASVTLTANDETVGAILWRSFSKTSLYSFISKIVNVSTSKVTEFAKKKFSNRVNMLVNLGPSDERVLFFAKYEQLISILKTISFVLIHSLEEDVNSNVFKAASTFIDSLITTWTTLDEYLVFFDKRYPKISNPHSLHFKAPLALLFGIYICFLFAYVFSIRKRLCSCFIALPKIFI